MAAYEKFEGESGVSLLFATWAGRRIAFNCGAEIFLSEYRQTLTFGVSCKTVNISGEFDYEEFVLAEFTLNQRVFDMPEKRADLVFGVLNKYDSKLLSQGENLDVMFDNILKDLEKAGVLAD